MNDLYLLTLIYIVLELFEVQWQKADTLRGMLAIMYRYYHSSVILFLLLHPTFYFTIYLAMITDYKVAILTVLLIKSIDIATKILLLRQLFEEESLSPQLLSLLDTPLHRVMPYLGIIVYTPLIVMGLL